MNLVELIKQDRIWAYCLSMFGVAIRGADWHRRWIEEIYNRRLR